MKKVNLGIILACVFISGVMIFLMWQGVSLKERRMVKWSGVAGAALAGKKLAKYLYPLIAEFGEVAIVGEDVFAQSFYQAFRATEDQAARGYKISFGVNERSQKTFLIRVVNIQQDFTPGCKAGDKLSCVGIKAKKKFNKKERDPQFSWISMYRLSKDEAVLFFQKKS